MKLLTKKIIESLPPLYSTDNQNISPVIVKFFNPVGSGTWYVVEGQPEYGVVNGKKEVIDYTFFGMADILEKELGYFTLSELQEVRLPFGLKIERDMYFENKKLDKRKLEIV